MRWSQDTITDEILKRSKGKIILIGKFYTVDIKTSFKCTVCGHEWITKPSNILYGTHCPDCSKKEKIERIKEYAKKNIGKSTMTHSEFIKEVYKKYNGEYTVIGAYNNKKTPVLMRHNECGNEWMIRPQNFLGSNNKCPKCAKKKRVKAARKANTGKPAHNRSNSKEFKAKLNKLHPNEYTPLEEYVTNKTKILMKHNLCGFEWKVSPDQMINNSRTECPQCKKMSKGEVKIKDLLIKRHMKFKTQYAFEDLIGGKANLLFDFALINKNDNPIYLIEYDGEQHYRPIKFMGGEKKFAEQILYDNKKNIYCKEHNIKLKRICYKEYKNLNTIINDVCLNIEKETA